MRKQKGGLLIGWDLDGVICDIDVTGLETMRQLEESVIMVVNEFGELKPKKDARTGFEAKFDRASVEKEYYRERKPLLDVRQMMHHKDKAVVITARPERIRPITEAWLSRYYPGLEQDLHIVDHAKYRNDGRPWYAAMAHAKAQKIKDLRVQVYYDDNPEIVEELRKLCSGVVVMQYGGRVALGEE